MSILNEGEIRRAVTEKKALRLLWAGWVATLIVPFIADLTNDTAFALNCRALSCVITPLVLGSTAIGVIHRTQDLKRLKKIEREAGGELLQVEDELRNLESRYSQASEMIEKVQETRKKIF